MENFSEREKKIIKILLLNKNKRPLTISVLTEILFKKDDSPPFDREISVTNSVNRIIKKCEFYNLNWIIHKEKYEGKLSFAIKGES